MPTTTKLDLETAAKTATRRQAALPICPKCGWYDTAPGIVEHRCHLQESAIADEIIEASGDLAEHATRLGYGERQLVFKLSDDLHIRFSIRGAAISFEDVFSLDDLTIDQVVRLVRAFKEILG